MAKDVFTEMASRWPSSVVARTEVEKFTGGAIRQKNLANLDCQGKGPKGRFSIGRKTCYPVDAFIEWLRARSA